MSLSLLALPELWLWLALLFFVVACLHSSVGLGGGSSYTALMVITGVAVPLIPVIALSLNIAVSATCTLRFARARLIPWSRLALLLSCSIPAAYLGGRLQVSTEFIMWLLFVSLLLVVLRLLLLRDPRWQLCLPHWGGQLLVMALGAGLGFLSGVVGIGGGIYLVPALVLLGLEDIRRAAACGAGFILCNSIAGLSAKLAQPLPDLYLWLLGALAVVVVMGGVLGSALTLSAAQVRVLHRALALVVALAASLLGLRLLSM